MLMSLTLIPDYKHTHTRILAWDVSGTIISNTYILQFPISHSKPPKNAYMYIHEYMYMYMHMHVHTNRNIAINKKNNAAITCTQCLKYQEI